jgi:hypothetical protein
MQLPQHERNINFYYINAGYFNKTSLENPPPPPPHTHDMSLRHSDPLRTESTLSLPHVIPVYHIAMCTRNSYLFFLINSRTLL